MYKYGLSLVIACYNEEPHLAINISRIESVFDDFKLNYEIIFIDDKSTDNTRSEIEKICVNKNNYRYIFHEKNIGRGGTVKEGLLMAQGEYAGFLDVDLEVNEFYLIPMVKALGDGYDAAVGYRFYDFFQADGKLRAILSLVYRLLTKYYLKMNVKDTEAGYKFFKLATTKGIIEQTKNDKWFWDTEIIYNLLAANKKIQEIPCIFIRNTNKKSTVKLWPDILDYLKAVIKFKK